MRFHVAPAALAALISAGACASPSGSSDAALLHLSAQQGAEMIPVAFVTQFAGFTPVQFEGNGQSGRSRNKFCLDFSVQEGDLTGTYRGCLEVNDPSDQTASRGINGWFTTAHTYEGLFDVCMPARGWCGTFEGGTGAAKVYPQPRGVEGSIAVAFGTGDFAGMKLQGVVTECEDSNGDRGCFVGTLQVPGGS